MNVVLAHSNLPRSILGRIDDFENACLKCNTSLKAQPQPRRAVYWGMLTKRYRQLKFVKLS